MKKNEREKIKLLSVTAKDLVWQEFRAGGKGGQAQNKKSTGVRCIHPPSGARGEGRDQRSQLQNKQNAFLRMTETKEFKTWLKVATAKALGQEVEIEKAVEKAMNPKNIRVEGKDEDGRWVEIDG